MYKSSEFHIRSLSNFSLIETPLWTRWILRIYPWIWQEVSTWEWSLFFIFWTSKTSKLTSCAYFVLRLIPKAILNNFKLLLDSKVKCTANLFTEKTAGFHYIWFPTVVSMYFLEWLSACSGSLQLSWRVSKARIFCGLIPAVSNVIFLISLHSITWTTAVHQLYFLKFDCWLF